MRRKTIYLILLAGAVIAGAFAVWYFTKPDNKQPASKPTQNSEQASGNQNGQPSEQMPRTYPVYVFFSKHPQSDNDPSATFSVSRTSPTSGVASFAVAEILKGPTAAESALGYFTTVRLRAGTAAQDFKISIDNGVATLQFLKPFDHLGVVADGQADSELKATLKQFSAIKKVIILNYRGDCEFDLSGQNLCKQ